MNIIKCNNCGENYELENSRIEQTVNIESIQLFGDIRKVGENRYFSCCTKCGYENELMLKCNK